MTRDPRADWGVRLIQPSLAPADRLYTRGASCRLTTPPVSRAKYPVSRLLIPRDVRRLSWLYCTGSNEKLFEVYSVSQYSWDLLITSPVPYPNCNHCLSGFPIYITDVREICHAWIRVGVCHANPTYNFACFDVLIACMHYTGEAVTTHTEVVTTPDASVTTPSASSQSVSSRTSKSLLTSVVSQTTDDAPSASSQASKSLLTYLLSLTTVDVTTMSTIMTSRRREYLTTSTAHDVASTRTTTTPVVRTSEEVLGQTSSSARAPISSDVATTDSLSTKRTSTLETHARSSREPPYATTSLLNRTSQTTTPPIVTVTSLPLDAKNVTPSFSDEQLANMTTQMPQTKIIMNESSADYTSEILNTTDSSTSGIIIDGMFFFYFYT